MNITYNAEQQAAIETAIAATADTRGADYEWSTAIVERNGQQFAVLGHIARELLAFTEASDEKARFEYVPMLVDGNMLARLPHEGRSGLAYLMRCTHSQGREVERPQWSVVYIETGWLYTRELELSNDEIMDNIAAEVDAGEPRVTGGRPGWS